MEKMEEPRKKRIRRSGSLFGERSGFSLTNEGRSRRVKSSTELESL